jgi:phosphoribosylamine--glycine ligase
MKVLIIGSGGREHALAWKVKQSRYAPEIFCTPGNPGMAKFGQCLDIKAGEINKLMDFATRQKIDFTVVGPEDSLSAGIVDEFENNGLKIFGPSQAAAKIESSKSFAKELMKQAGIPTADFRVFTAHEQALAYVQSQRYPIVIKASGLAQGKGVVICHSPDEAKAELQAAMVDKVFGQAGESVVIEEFLEGQEISVHAFCDGERAVLFPPAQDHKQALDGDLGPNTGGMGSIAPVAWVTPGMMDEIKTTVILPALKMLREMGTPFRGCLFPGLIHTSEGFKVLEFNARFGDPETQSYMRLLESDLLEIMLACAEGRLDEGLVKWSGKSAACIVAASKGYPGSYEKGLEITGVEAAEKAGAVIFQAGTAVRDGKLVTSGGRVLGVTAAGADLESALAESYQSFSLIRFSGMYYRKDIGRRRAAI